MSQNLLHSLTKFKARHNFVDTTYDAVLLDLMAGIKARIESYLGRVLLKQERTEIVYFRGPMMPLKALPVDTTQPITVTRISSFTDGGTTVVLDPIEYDVTPYGMRLAAPAKEGERIQVIYTGGYTATTVEGSNFLFDFSDEDASSAIARAAAIQLIHEWNTKSKPSGEQITTDAGTATFKALALLQEVTDTLIPARHPRLCGWFQ